MQLQQACGLQVTGVELKGGVAEVAVAEMQVASVGLRFINAKTGEARDEGATRPDIVLRHLTTRPGRVSAKILPFNLACMQSMRRQQRHGASKKLLYSLSIVKTVIALAAYHFVVRC